MSKGSGAGEYVLKNGANIAVVGGGPTGSFFSIFALKMAKMIGRELNITIFDPKDFTRDGPIGCNRCGGVISELLVQMLAVEGINFPPSVVQRGINSYRLHTGQGDVFIATPSFERTIATVYRGGGPKGIVVKNMENFDNFLLHQAVNEGAAHKALKIDRVEYVNKRPLLYSRGQKVQDADLVVGAFGVNSSTSRIFEDLGFGYEKPGTVTTAIAEISMREEAISEFLGDAIHLFLLPYKNIKFAALIPKGTYVTLCILGRDMNVNTVKDFLDHPVVRKVLPEPVNYSVCCSCLPKMNVGAPRTAFSDRVIMCGDAGSTRLFKDGLGAAYTMGKAAARTAVFHGVGKENFLEDYYPAYRDLIIDNRFGKYLFAVTDLIKTNALMTKSMLAVVNEEQQKTGDPKTLSSILWDMFTGNERYKKIFFRSLDMKVHFAFLMESVKVISGRYGLSDGRAGTGRVKGDNNEKQ